MSFRVRRKLSKKLYRVFKKKESFINKAMELSEGCKDILRQLLKQRLIGGKNIPETLCRRLIKHLPKQEQRQAKKDFETCIKEGLVLTKPKPSDRHIFLNQKRIKEIRKLIKHEN